MNILYRSMPIWIAGLVPMGFSVGERERPAETAGKKIHNIEEQAGDKVEQAAEKLKEKTDK